MKVYLAGGMRHNWRDYFREILPTFQFYDPSRHGLRDEIEYTKWDLNHIRLADVVVAYMEEDNPSGIGMSLEIGYAAALGKPVILYDARSPIDDRFSRYMGMARIVCENVYSLQEVVERLKTYELE